MGRNRDAAQEAGAGANARWRIARGTHGPHKTSSTARRIAGRAQAGQAKNNETRRRTSRPRHVRASRSINARCHAASHELREWV